MIIKFVGGEDYSFQTTTSSEPWVCRADNIIEARDMYIIHISSDLRSEINHDIENAFKERGGNTYGFGY